MKNSVCWINSVSLSPSYTERKSIQTLVKTHLTNERNYTGLSEGRIYKRYIKHTAPFRHDEKTKVTNLESRIWAFETNNIPYIIKYKTIEKSKLRIKEFNKSDLCKFNWFLILNSLLNWRPEIFSVYASKYNLKRWRQWVAVSLQNR